MHQPAILALVFLLLSSSAFGQQPPAPAQTPPAAAQPAPAQAPAPPDKAKLSYALGLDLGTQLHKQGVDIDPEIFANAFRDAWSGAELKMTREEAQTVIAAFQEHMRKKLQAAAAAASAKNKAEGDTFLAANKAKEGVVMLPSGLQYRVVTKGTGPTPTLTDTVDCHYRGTLIDGTEFDSSYKRKQPASFKVNGVIRGWTEALQLMPVGSKWELYVPAALGYGERGAGQAVPPNATLIFEVELLAIKGKS